MAACQLLLEITCFLRETYQHMPRSRTSRHSGVGLDPSSAAQWAAAGSGADRGAGSGSSRRWSSVLGSPGHSERSNSRSSQCDSHGQGLSGFFVPSRLPSALAHPGAEAVVTPLLCRPIPFPLSPPLPLLVFPTSPLPSRSLSLFPSLPFSPARESGERLGV